MSDDIPPPQPDPNSPDAKAAKAVFFQATLIRVLGLGLVLVGVTIFMDKFPGLPPVAGIVLIVAGLFQMLVMPLMLIRRFVRARKARAERE